MCTSKFYPGELGRIIRRQSDGWLVVVWSGHPHLRCFMRDFAVVEI
jgi:hypothetical protein